MGAAEQIIDVLADLSPDDPLRAAVEGTGSDLNARVERVRRGLDEGTLVLGIQRQISGYWFAPHEEISATAPTYDPTGAVLPRLGETLGSGAISLDLIPIEFVWFPLSDAGAYTYRHSIGLLRGEKWRFVPRDTTGTPWPTVYAAELAARLAPSEVEPLYGVEAARRARPEYNAVQIRLWRPPT